MRILLSCALLVTLAGCGNAPSDADCEKLLEHTVALELAAAGVEPGAAQAQTQTAELTELARDEFIETCRNDMPRQRVTCALAAKSKPDLLACDEQ